MLNQSDVISASGGGNISRNESVRMSGSELLRQFKQCHQNSLRDSSLNKSGIFDINKKKLKIIRNPKSPSPMRNTNSSTRNHHTTNNT